MNQDVQPYREPEVTPVGHSGTRVEIQERPAWSINGWFGVVVVLALIAVTVLARPMSLPTRALADRVQPSLPASSSSLVIVQPGHTKVVRFFGSYVGTVRRTGLSWILPLADRRSLSIRVRNFETNHLKVNDADGNPVEIAAIVVWQVADTSRRHTPSMTTSTSSRSRPSRRCATSRPPIPTTTPPGRARRCAATSTSWLALRLAAGRSTSVVSSAGDRASLAPQMPAILPAGRWRMRVGDAADRQRAQRRDASRARISEGSVDGREALAASMRTASRAAGATARWSATSSHPRAATCMLRSTATGTLIRTRT